MHLKRWRTSRRWLGEIHCRLLRPMCLPSLRVRDRACCWSYHWLCSVGHCSLVFVAKPLRLVLVFNADTRFVRVEIRKEYIFLSRNVLLWAHSEVMVIKFSASQTTPEVYIVGALELGGRVEWVSSIPNLDHLRGDVRCSLVGVGSNAASTGGVLIDHSFSRRQ